MTPETYRRVERRTSKQPQRGFPLVQLRQQLILFGKTTCLELIESGFVFILLFHVSCHRKDKRIAGMMNDYGGSSPSRSFGLELRDSAVGLPPSASGILQPGTLSFRQREDLVAAQQHHRQRSEDMLNSLGLSQRPQLPPNSSFQQSRGQMNAAGNNSTMHGVDSLYGARSQVASGGGGSQDFSNPFLRQMHPERPTVEQLVKYKEQASVEDAFSTPSFVSNRLCPWCGLFCPEDHIAQCDRRLVCCPVCDDLVFSKDAFEHLQRCQENVIRIATERVEKRLKQIKQEKEEELERQRVAQLIQQAEADAAALRERANARLVTTTKQSLPSLIFSGISEADVQHDVPAAPAAVNRRQSVVQLGGEEAPGPSSPQRRSLSFAGPEVDSNSSDQSQQRPFGMNSVPVPSFRVAPGRQGSIAAAGGGVASPMSAPIRALSAANFGAQNRAPSARSLSFTQRPGDAGSGGENGGVSGDFALAPSIMATPSPTAQPSSVPAGAAAAPTTGAAPSPSVNSDPIPPGFKRCKWCSTPAPPEHEKKCASRIVMCKKCSSMIKMKEKDAHVKMCTAINGTAGQSAGGEDA